MTALHMEDAAPNRRELVLWLLKDGKWHTTMEINAVDIGGSEGCRRVRELRALMRAGKIPGFRDIARKKSKVGGSTQWEYQVIIG